MSDESNRDRTVNPSDLQASDFFPPGHGWNKGDSKITRELKPIRRECVEDETAIDGGRPH